MWMVFCMNVIDPGLWRELRIFCNVVHTSRYVYIYSCLLHHMNTAYRPTWRYKCLNIYIFLHVWYTFKWHWLEHISVFFPQVLELEYYRSQVSITVRSLYNFWKLDQKSKSSSGSGWASRQSMIWTLRRRGNFKKASGMAQTWHRVMSRLA